MAPTTLNQRIVKKGMRTGDLPITDDLIALAEMDQGTEEAKDLAAKIAGLTKAYVDKNQPPPKVPKGTSKQVAVLPAADGTAVNCELRFTAKGQDKTERDVNRYSLRIKDNANDDGHKDSVFSFGVVGTAEQFEGNTAPTIGFAVHNLLSILKPVVEHATDPVAYCESTGINTADADKLNAGVQRFQKAKLHLDKLLNIIGEAGWDALVAFDAADTNDQIESEASTGE